MPHEALLPTLQPMDSRQFYIAARKLADTLSYGTDHSRFLGSGIEYVQSRRYLPGDPVRSVDWRVTARTGKFHVKEYEAPKRLPAYILIDTSASMTISSTRKSKYELAVHIGAGIGFACLDRVSPVGVLGVGERDLRITPSLSRHQIMEWSLRLRRYRFDERTFLGRRLTELAPTLYNQSLVIVVSDLHDPAAVPALKLLAQKHDCAVIQLQDPAETGLPGAGFLRAKEAETGTGFVTRAKKRWIDAGQTKKQLQRSGIDYILLRTDEPIAQRLRHFFQSRDLIGKGAR